MTVKKTGAFPVFLTVMVLFLSHQREKTEKFPCPKYEFERFGDGRLHMVPIVVACGLPWPQVRFSSIYYIYTVCRYGGK